MKVCIAEKPSVAREIAHILGAKTKRNGYFEGNGYQVTWTFGHLCTLKEPQDYDPQFKWWKMYHLPILPEKFGIKEINNNGVAQQMKVISGLVRNASEVINCGDAGQEGELIQRWVLTKVKCKVQVRRLWISSLTEDAIREGFQKLKDSKAYDLLYAAGSSRAIGDWLLGINATRAYTLKYGNGKQVLSVGRVQTPTLALIVNRHLEIQNFRPELYWELKTTYREVVFSAKSGKFFKKEEAEKVLATIQEKPFYIVSFIRKEGKESPPKLFDLTSLQVECNKKFGFSADLTLKIVQALYEKKLVTYPRVDTTYLPDDVYPKVKGILTGLKKYANLVGPLLERPIRKTKNVFDNKKVTDHHAIIPTGVPANNLYNNEEQVYDLIARRFIANFYPDSKVSKTEVIGNVESILFKATGKQVLEDGWRIVFKEDTASKKETGDEGEKNQGEDQVLPEFIKGETGQHQPVLAEKETSPPKYFTEATLLRAMETAGKQVDNDELRELMKENGIGRPSTRANIIETLFKRNYVKKEKKNLIPTITGIQLIKTIDYELVKSVELTGVWEKKLRDIEKGTYEVKLFLEEMKGMVSDIVRQVKVSKAVINIDVPENKAKEEKEKKKDTSKGLDLTCPKCKNGMLLKGKKAYGCSNYKTGCPFILPFEFYNKKLTQKQVKDIIKTGKSSLIKGIKIEGFSKEGILVLDKNLSLQLEESEKTPLQCPKCKEGSIIAGKAAYGCSEWKKGCNFRLPFVFMGKKLTEGQIKNLVQGNATETIQGLQTTDSPEVFNRKLKLDPEFYIRMK